MRLALFVFLCASCFGQTISGIDDAPGVGTLTCPEPASLPTCTGFCWEVGHDPGTIGTSCGNTSLNSAITRDGQSRRFVTSWTGFGGELYHAYLGNTHLDTVSTNFSYDTWAYFTDLTHVQNIEMDMNQVLENGDTVIFGTQCNFPAGFWQFTTSILGGTHWNTSSVPCSKAVWTANTWHHVVIQSHRDAIGTVFYDSVTFDGSTVPFVGAFGTSAFSLGWTPHGTLLVNFQIDGDNTANGTTAYLDQFSVTGSVPNPQPAPVSGVLLGSIFRSGTIQ